jgi:hypothetical protein
MSLKIDISGGRQETRLAAQLTHSARSFKRDAPNLRIALEYGCNSFHASRRLMRLRELIDETRRAGTSGQSAVPVSVVCRNCPRHRIQESLGNGGRSLFNLDFTQIAFKNYYTNWKTVLRCVLDCNVHVYCASLLIALELGGKGAEVELLNNGVVT